jgi:hypothetical protein
MNYQKKDELLGAQSTSDTLTDMIIDLCVDELNKPGTKNKLKISVVDPIVKDINERYYYQFLMLISLLIAIVILLLILISKTQKHS